MDDLMGLFVYGKDFFVETEEAINENLTMFVSTNKQIHTGGGLYTNSKVVVDSTKMEDSAFIRAAQLQGEQYFRVLAHGSVEKRQVDDQSGGYVRKYVGVLPPDSVSLVDWRDKQQKDLIQDGKFSEIFRPVMYDILMGVCIALKRGHPVGQISEEQIFVWEQKNGGWRAVFYLINADGFTSEKDPFGIVSMVEKLIGREGKSHEDWYSFLTNLKQDDYKKVNLMNCPIFWTDDECLEYIGRCAHSPKLEKKEGNSESVYEWMKRKNTVQWKNKITKRSKGYIFRMKNPNIAQNDHTFLILCRKIVFHHQKMSAESAMKEINSLWPAYAVYLH